MAYAKNIRCSRTPRWNISVAAGTRSLPHYPRKLAENVRGDNGTARALRVEEPDSADFIALFNHSQDYAALLDEVAHARETLPVSSLPDTIRLARRLRKRFSTLARIDFFPNEAQQQADASLRDLEQE